MRIAREIVEQGFREADLVLEHTFRIPARHQGYLEPHAGAVAIDGDGRVQVWASVKNPFGVRSQLSKALGVPEERIRMNVVNVGGEFGGKGDGVDLTVAYFLAQKSGKAGQDRQHLRRRVEREQSRRTPR